MVNQSISKSVSLLALATLLSLALLVPGASVDAKCIGCDKTKDGNDANLLTKPPEPSADPTPAGAPPLAPDIVKPVLQSGTQSTTLQSGMQSTTLQTGTQSTTLQSGTQSTTLQSSTDSTLIQANVQRQSAPLTILILVDCSQSMKEDIKGMFSSDKQDKMDAAKKVLENAIQGIPSDIDIGLRVFGQSFNSDPFTDCQQSALLVPIGRGNRRSIIEQVRQIRPYGLTPLTYALTQAKQDLDRRQGKRQIILISDGAETCGGDPCAYVRKLISLGYQIKIDIVGVGLKRDYEAKEQLNCIAESSGGKFYDANTAGELMEGIRTSVKEAVSGRVMTKMSQPVLDQLPADLRN